MLNLWVPILPERIWSKIDPKTVTTSFQNSPLVVGPGPFQVVESQKSHFTRLVGGQRSWRTHPQSGPGDLPAPTRTPTPWSRTSSPAGWQPSRTCRGANRRPCPRCSASRRSAASPRIRRPRVQLLHGRRQPGNPVLEDWKFRQALSSAIDEDQIVKIAYAGPAYRPPASSRRLLHGYGLPFEPPGDEKYTSTPPRPGGAGRGRLQGHQRRRHPRLRGQTNRPSPADDLLVGARTSGPASCRRLPPGIG